MQDDKELCYRIYQEHLTRVQCYSEILELSPGSPYVLKSDVKAKLDGIYFLMETLQGAMDEYSNADRKQD